MVREARKRVGLTQAQLGRALRVSHVAVCRYEVDGEGIGPERARFARKYLAHKPRQRAAR